MVSDHRDAIRRRVASVMLEAVADTDFVLTGASALIEHGLINRPTDDVDLFSTRKDEGRVPEAVARMQAALEARGATVETTDVFPGFSTGTVHWGDVDVEFDVGIDWRAYDAITLDIGRVLDVRDSIGSKTAALYSRYELRDYMDVAAIILDGRWTPEQVMQMGANNDPGFDRDRRRHRERRRDPPRRRPRSPGQGPRPVRRHYAQHQAEPAVRIHLQRHRHSDRRGSALPRLRLAVVPDDRRSRHGPQFGERHHQLPAPAPTPLT